jgi:uncharacterized membrane protein
VGELASIVLALVISICYGMVGENRFESTPTATYGVVLLLAGFAYVILQRCIIAHQGSHSLLATAVGADWKGKLSLVLYGSAILISFVHPWISNCLYVVVAMMWFIPDRRIERTITKGVDERH